MKEEITFWKAEKGDDIIFFDIKYDKVNGDIVLDYALNSTKLAAKNIYWDIYSRFDLIQKNDNIPLRVWYNLRLLLKEKGFKIS